MVSQSDEYQSWRQARRTVARQHHPDLGGDPVLFMQLLREVDDRFGVSPGSSSPNHPTARAEATSAGRRISRATGRARRRVRHGTRWARGRLPRRFPGARRYYDL